MTQIFGGTQGRDDTNATLADDKIGIEYPPTQCHHYYPIGSVLDTQCQLKYGILSVYRLKTRILPNLSPMPADGKVGIGYPRISVPDAILTIKSVRYQVPDANSNIVPSSAAICHRGS